MKKTVLVLLAVLSVAAGGWAYVSGVESASLRAYLGSGLAVLFGANLLLGLWLWYRSAPGSGDAMVAPTLVLLSAFVLLGILPRLLWPTVEGLHTAGSVVSLVGLALLVIAQIRRRRKVSQGTGPV